MRQRLHFSTHDACEALGAAVVDTTLSELGSVHARRRHYPSGSAIWQPSDLPDRVFRLQSGRVHILIVTAEGEEQLYRAVAPGELFGEMCFCAHRHEPHGSVARSLGRSEVWATSYEDFRRIVRDDASLIDAVLQTFCTRVGAAEERARMLACRDARERLARLLVQLAHAKPRHDAARAATRGIAPGAARDEAAALTLTHADLAAMAALSRPHVSVLMTEFRDRGFVSYGRAGPLRVRTARLRKALKIDDDE